MIEIAKKGMSVHQASNIKQVKGLEITKLEKMRVKQNLSQAELAELANLPLRRIQSYEQRSRLIDSSRLSTLLDLCIALKCNLEDIIEETESISKLHQISTMEKDDYYDLSEESFQFQKQRYMKLFHDGNFTDDQREGINFLLKDFSESWKEILKLRYEQGLTYEQIGSIRGISKGRVGQIIEKALLKLKKIENSEYVIYGLKEYQKRAQREKDNASLLEISIKELGLSGRAYNSLMRSGLDTIGKLETITRDELKTIKNMGDNAADEVITKINAYVSSKI